MSFLENKHKKSLTEQKCVSLGRAINRLGGKKKKNPGRVLLPVTQPLNKKASVSANTQDELCRKLKQHNSER